MNSNRLSARQWAGRIALALAFVGIGGLVYTVFSPLRPRLPIKEDYLGRIALTLTLLIVALCLRRSSRGARYWPLAFGLFIMSLAVSLDWIFACFLLDSVGVDGSTPTGYALLKLNECAVIWVVVLLFTRVAGGTFGSVYVQRGNLRLGLIVGLGAFLLAAAASIPLAAFLFKGRDLTLDHILPWTPWLLLFVLANAAQEELLFRGLFLRKLEPFFGRFFSNLLVMLVFTALHNGVTYTSNQLYFLAAVVPLALAWGYVMQKTDAIWASILFHAGMDIPIMLGIFSNL